MHGACKLMEHTDDWPQKSPNSEENWTVSDACQLRALAVFGPEPCGMYYRLHEAAITLTRHFPARKPQP